jgi:hypothetical protein
VAGRLFDLPAGLEHVAVVVLDGRQLEEELRIVWR